SCDISLHVKGFESDLDLNDKLVAYRGSDITQIVGTGKRHQGSYALMGMGIGAAIGGVITSIILGTYVANSNNEPCTEGYVGFPVAGAVALGLDIGGTGGGICGLGIGALIPKNKKIRIVPIVPTSKTATNGFTLSKNF
ncbi:MAG: hypothetical protein KDD48_09090, partial [Bdellovibrionales bacterium]|nr:hypothetical protein [Bdellovibrionales bacterium]